MKYKTTAKAIRQGATRPRSAGYCSLQYLLYYHNPNAYTCGTYGWNFDVYEVYGLTICTGYRGMVGKRLEKVDEYEKKASKIINSNCDNKKELVEQLLEEFCELNSYSFITQ